MCSGKMSGVIEFADGEVSYFQTDDVELNENCGYQLRRAVYDSLSFGQPVLRITSVKEVSV